MVIFIAYVCNILKLFRKSTQSESLIWLDSVAILYLFAYFIKRMSNQSEINDSNN